MPCQAPSGGIPVRRERQRVGRVARLRPQVAQVRGRDVQPGRHPLGDLQTEALELLGLVGGLGEQREPADAERGEHLRRRAVVPLVLAAAETHVGLERVQAPLLQGVGIELRVETDAATFLPQVEQEAADGADPLEGLPELRTAVAPLAAEHVAGQALAVRPHQGRRSAGGGAAYGPLPVAERERHVLLAVDETLEAEHPRGGGEAVLRPHGQGHLATHGGAGEDLAGGGNAPGGLLWYGIGHDAPCQDRWVDHWTTRPVMIARRYQRGVWPASSRSRDRV